MAVGLFADSKLDEAKVWAEKAAAAVEAHADEDQTVARILRSPSPTPLAVFHQVMVSPAEKALLATLLAQRFPEARAGYLDQAALFNVRRMPPSLVGRRVLAGAAAQP